MRGLHSGLSMRWYLALLGIAVVTPLLIVGGIFSDRFAADQQASIQLEARRDAAELADLIDQELNRALAAITALGTSPDLRDGRLEDFHAQAISVAKLFPSSVIGLRDAEGRILLTTASPFTQTPIGVTDASLVDLDKEVAKTGRSAVSGLYVGTVTQRRFVNVILPISRPGESVKLLSLGLSPERIHALIAARDEGGRRLIGVIDRNNLVIARSTSHDTFVGRRASAQYNTATSEQNGTFTGMSLEGVAVLSSYVRSALSGWRVTVSVPLAVVEAPLRRSQAFMASLAAAGVLLSTLMALLAAHLLVTPLTKLQRMAAQTGRGDTPDISTTGVREFDEIARILAKSSTEINDRQSRQNTLVNELNHRVKNTLTIVQALARRTARTVVGLPQFQKSFEGRLIALSKSHDALTSTGWQGAPLADLMFDVCTPIIQDRGRLRPSGPSVELSPKQTLALGMIFHELATNAVKYGAASNETGYVTVRWAFGDQDRGSLAVTWAEHAGPPVAPPSAPGFGSTLITNVTKQDLSGDVVLGYEASGLVCTLSFPLVPHATLDIAS